LSTAGTIESHFEPKIYKMFLMLFGLCFAKRLTIGSITKLALIGLSAVSYFYY